MRLLLTLQKSIRGEAALIEKIVTKPLDATTLAMQEGYAAAKDKGSYTFPEPGLDISEKIGSDGRAQISFPLPNGETLRLLQVAYSKSNLSTVICVTSSQEEIALTL